MTRLQAELKGKWVNKCRKERITIFICCRAVIERENHDLTLEQIKLKAAEHRVTVLESVK